MLTTHPGLRHAAPCGLGGRYLMAMRAEVLEHVRTWPLGKYPPCVLLALRAMRPPCGYTLPRWNRGQGV